MRNKAQMNRRGFLGALSAVAVSPLLVPANVLGREGTVAPNERIVTAFVGMGSRGFQVMGDFTRARKKPFHIVAVCDCYTKPLENARNWVNRANGNSDCLAYSRYEDILDRKDVDLITITTPDHWHTKITVEACRAGKDVYCEKPLTLTPMESREIIAAARKYNRVCGSGSQRVIEDYGYMAPVVKSGALGEVNEAYFSVGGPAEDLYYPEEPVPDGFDWDRWLGPAPWAPYSYERSNGSYGGGWRRCWDYGNGFLADWGAHKLGGILYVLGLDDQEPVEILPPRCEKNPGESLIWIYKDGRKIHHTLKGYDITLVGSEREFRHGNDRGRIKPLGAVPLRLYADGTTKLCEDFAHAVYHRTRPFQDLAYGAATATACQLANITYKLNRPLKWDAENTCFVDDEIANRFVARPRRAPYLIEFISLLIFLVSTMWTVLLDASETSDLFNRCLGEMSSDNQGTRKVTQQNWMQHCLENSAQSDIRAEAQDLMTLQVNSDLPVESAVWLIRVLGRIGDAQAVPVLEKRLADKELRIADEAVRALANIPAEEAAKALERTASPLALAASKERSIDRNLLKKTGHETVMPLALPDATDQAVADWMKYYGGLSNVDKARTLANLTKRQRDAKYVSLAIAASKSEDEFLRDAGIAAIGVLGDSQHLLLLLDLAFQDATREQAKTAMVRMRGRALNAGLANALRQESDPDRFEIIADVMTQRFDPMAKTLIFGPVRENDWPNRITLLQFAEELASKDDVGDFVAVWERINDASQKDRAEQIVARLVNGDSSAVLKYRTENNHAAMFSLLGRIGDKSSLDEIRDRVFDKPLKEGMTASAPLKAAAFRALCNWPDARVADDLYTVASNGQLADSERISALRAFIRVISLPRDRLRIGLDEKGQVEKLASAMDLATRKEEKELVLQRVGQVRCVESLNFAMKYCDDEQLRPSAFGAVVDLAHHTDLRNSDKEAFAAALDKVLAESKASQQRERAKQYRDAIK